MIFEIPGDPIAQKRPRVFVRGKHAIAWDSQGKEKESLCHLLHLAIIAYYDQSKEKGMEISKLTFCDYYMIDLEFHLSYPKMWKEKDKNAYLWGLKICDDNKDLDNLEKLVLDVCKNELIKDDRYIIKLSSKKEYSLTPKTVIKIMAKKHVNVPSEEVEILSMIPPKDFIKLRMAIDDLQIILQGINDPKLLCDQVYEMDNGYHKQQLSEASYVISYLADHFGPVLTKIAKKYPGYWQKQLEKEKRFDNTFRDGKTIC